VWWVWYIGGMENKIKVEIEMGGIENLDDALRVARLVYHPNEEEAKKYHNKDNWKGKIENDGLLVVGKADGQIVGFVLAYKTSDEVMHVWNAGVIAKYRKLGIFSNMFEELAVKCRQEGVKKITLNTIETKFPEMYKYVINKGFVEYEKEWIDDYQGGKVEQSKFEMSLG